MSDNLKALVHDTGKYIEAKTELWKLKAADKTTEVASSVASHLVIVIIGLLVIISLNTGVALLLGKWLGEMYYGFFIVAGFYVLLGLIVYANRTTLMKTPFYNSIINKMLK
ncbi:MAG: hypothetical protein ACTHLE_12235 [Agriterribacter sp.]